MNNIPVELTPFEIGYLIGMTVKDKNIPRGLWLKLHIASAKCYLEHPTYAGEAKRSIERWMGELADLTKKPAPVAPVVEPPPTEPMWRTKDGRQIPVRSMTDDHIVRAISLLQRRAVEKIVFDEANTTVANILKRTRIKVLIDEAERRGLKINK